jgi:Ca2+-binding RTX toxin-like protein
MAIINGTIDDDILVGTASADTISAGGGNDILIGGAGIDSLLGGDGNDWLNGSTADTIVINASGDVPLHAAKMGVFINGILSSVVNVTNPHNDSGAGVNYTVNAPLPLDAIESVEVRFLSDDESPDSIGAALYVYSVTVGDQAQQDPAFVNRALDEDTQTVFSYGGASATYTFSGAHGAVAGPVSNDRLEGGLGDDTYVVDSTTGDVIVELGGYDRVYSSVSYTLPGTTLATSAEALILREGSAATEGTGNLSDNVLLGNSAGNKLSGLGGNDTLDGKGGTDTLIGGLGDDTYVIDAAGDVITELAGEGADTVVSSLTYTLGAVLENLTLSGADDINGTGNDLGNVLIGNFGANRLEGGKGIDRLADGGGGHDTLVGGADGDIYTLTDIGTTITELATDTGIDEVFLFNVADYTLAANVEYATINANDPDLTALTLVGNLSNNRLTGDITDDHIVGGGGSDTLIGGLGDDDYVVDGNDLIIEGVDEGIDSVTASVDYTLVGTNLETLTLSSGGAINGTGNDADNTLFGNGLGNHLIGGKGNDWLDGRTGSDTLTGGLDNDTYVLDRDTDVVEEFAGEGIDTVVVSFDYVLLATSNVENVTLTSAALNATGNDGDNALMGNGNANRLEGGKGDDYLSGGGGQDTLVGGDGSDVYSIKNASTLITEVSTDAGIDEVFVRNLTTYTLADNVENATMNAYGLGVVNLALTGNALNNRLRGSFTNDVLKGGAGPVTGLDTFLGGLGDDRYFVDSSDDVVIEFAGEGDDTVISTADYTLRTGGVENLTLGIGSAAKNGTGNDLDNTLLGNAQNNVLVGGKGNDWLDGKTGADTLTGGLGDDTYSVDNIGDVVDELAGEGIDTVNTTLNNYSLAGTNAENLSLALGSAVAINGTGNDLNNYLTGNQLGNSLTGGLGNDTLAGGLGVDTLVGGLGDDTYVVDEAGEVITELADQGTDTVEASITYDLKNTELENVTLTGEANIDARGNGFGNVLIGNKGANILQGFAGNDLLEGDEGDDVLVGGGGVDTLKGGVGNDTYFLLDNVGHQLMELAGEGVDTVELYSAINAYTLGNNIENAIADADTSVQLTGNDLGNVLTGSNLGDTLNGGLGIDILNGGAGADVYYVDNAADVVTDVDDSAASQIDTVRADVSYTLATNNFVENLELNAGKTAALVATGNTGNNRLTGNAYGNTLYGLAGNDTLYGGDDTVADTLWGGAGDDTYYLNASNNDTINEANAADGTDTIATIGATLVSLGANIENATAEFGTVAVKFTGNGLANLLVGSAKNDVLLGGAGDDTLRGGLGADNMTGGTGNDTYFVDSASDVLTAESTTTTEIDQVISSVTWTLATNYENLTLDGTAALSGTGNAGNNILVGNGNANTLTGLTGADVLDGGAGNDTLYGDAAGASTVTGGNDTLTGGSGNDTLYDYSTASLDTYNWGRGLGADTLTDAGGSGDKLIISGAVASQVWFSHLSGTRDLRVAVIGTSDAFVVKNWFASTSTTDGANTKLSTGVVETLTLANGQAGDITLASAKVQGLVDAMAGFSTTVPATTDLPANAPANLTNLITNSWV